LGEFAAILTSVFWTLSAIIFTFASRKVGSVVLNRLRLAFALVMLFIFHLLTQGKLIPLDAAPERWLWLGLSGIIGLTLGDLALFQSYKLVGPRIGTLIMSCVPVLSVILAWLTLHETLRLVQILGILLAVSGIAVVVLERGGNGSASHDTHNYRSGIFFGFLAAIGQTVGLILTKQGVQGGFSSISAVLIRLLVATVAIWIVTFATRQTRATIAVLRDRKTFGLILAGSIVGPFLGVWFSTIAVQLSAVGVASTLTSLNPIFLLPFAHWLFHEKITPRAIAATFITLAGVMILFLL
jgi:drug/metabolite transporter (DMT)-like permease